MRRATPRHQRAFTLVELMIGIGVLAVILTLAAPSFRDFILMQRLKGIHVQLVTDLQFARSEAISRGLEVNVKVQEKTTANPLSCYIVFTDTARNYSRFGASSNCDCHANEGNRCTAAGTTEIRTVQVPASSGVFLSLPSTQAVAFDPVTGGMVLVLTETGVGSGREFTIFSSIDASRKLAAVVGLSGRPTVCRPAGSTMRERAC